MATKPFGREKELAILEEQIAQAGQGRGAITFVEGPAGIGKTLLVEAALERAPITMIAKGAGWELEQQRAFGPLLDAFGIRARSEDPVAREIYSLLHVEETGEREAGGQVRFRVAERIVDLLEDRASQNGLVLWLDDLQWADSATFVALGRLLEIIPESPVSLLLAHRPTERGHEIDHLHARTGSLARSIVLRPLGTEAVGELVTDLLGAPAGPTLKKAVEGAAGNPFFVTQFISTLDEEGLLKRDEDSVDSIATRAPTSFRLAALRRLAFIAPDSVDALRMASILGSRFTLRDLAVATELDEFVVADRLEQPLISGFLTASESGYRFAHDLIREALYDDLAPPRRTTMHRHVADRLLAAGEPVTRAAPHLALGATKGDITAVQHLEAAAHVIASSEPAEAVGLLEKAHLLCDDNLDKARISEQMVKPLVWLGRLKEAEEKAEAAMKTLGPTCEIVSQLATAFYFHDRPKETRTLLETALGTPDLQESDRCAFLARLSFFEIEDMDLAKARALEALPLAQRLKDIESEGLALMTLALFQDHATSIETSRTVIRMAETKEGRDLARHHPHLSLASIEAYSGDLDAAEATLEAGLRLGEEAGTLWHHHHYSLSQSVICLVRGEWDRAIAEARKAVEAARTTEVTFQVDASRLVIAGIAARRGDPAAARAALSGMEPPSEERWIDHQAYAWVQMLVTDLEGHGEEAVRLAVGNWERLDRGQRRHANLQGYDILLTTIRNDRLDVATGIAADFKRLRDAIPGPLSYTLIAGAEALVGTDLGETMEAARALEDAQRPWEAAHVFLHAAQLAAGQKQPRLIEEAATNAIAILERLGAEREIRRADSILRDAGSRRGPRQARTRARAGWESITKGEWAVLDLLAGGAGNREIADRLFISKRTVESHVGSLFRKLQVKSRVELATRALERRATQHDQGIQETD